jgi:hypothetical protein
MLQQGDLCYGFRAAIRLDDGNIYRAYRVQKQSLFYKVQLYSMYTL